MKTRYKQALNSKTIEKLLSMGNYVVTKEKEPIDIFQLLIPFSFISETERQFLLC